MKFQKFKTTAECDERLKWLDEQLAVTRRDTRHDASPYTADLIKKLEREQKSIFKRRIEIQSPALL